MKNVPIPITGNIFLKSPDEIRKIADIYQKLLQKKPDQNSFYQTPEEVEEILKMCIENNIQISGMLFHKKAEKLKKNVQLIKEKYGQDYLLPQIIVYSKEHIERIFSYLKGKRCLEIIKISPGIMHLTLDEIIDREIIIIACHEEFVVNGKFHPFFSLSKKAWLEQKKYYLKQQSKQEEENEENYRTHNRK